MLHFTYYKYLNFIIGGLELNWLFDLIVILDSGASDIFLFKFLTLDFRMSNL